MTGYPHLFEPGAIGGLTIRNRIVQPPMGTGLVENGHLSPRDVAFQEERARAGVGLIITGAAVVHPTSLFPVRIIVEAWDEDGIDALRARCEAVQRHGARIFGQLVHLGRESPGGLTNSVPMGPSPVASPRDPSPPHEMSVAEVRMIVEAFARSAANFQAAGYDGVEISAGHGYLLAQFLSPASNRRKDAYRGDKLEGRTRLLREIVEAMRNRCGDRYPLGIRLSAEEETPDGLTLDDTREIVYAIQDAAPVDYISLTAGMRGSYVKDATYPEGFTLDWAATVKQDVDVPVMAAGRIRFPDLAERAVASGQVDFVAIGRGVIADPEWVSKAREGRAAEIRPCIGIVQDCRAAHGQLGCAVNARAGRELEWEPVRRAAAPKRVVVAGAGPAGLEAARVAAEAGHEVVLYERADVTGGQLRIAAAGPTREELLDFVFYAERELARLGVEMRLGTPATRDAVLADAPDLVVAATGARPMPPEFPFDAEARVATVWELLGGAVKVPPPRAAVLDDGSGFWHGISAAEYLAERGAAVELLTPARGIALAIPHESVAGVLGRLGSNGVRYRTLTTVTSVRGSTVSLADVVTDESSQLEADLLVVRTRLLPDDALLRELVGEVPALVAVGDCSAGRRLTHAVLDANSALRRFESGRLDNAGMVAF
ncbi:MAG TPA: FAD-dependent oxidoreductase [Gaiellaceae bacterium]|nr:FAD-dependent oxidoreductase [Gaiellaceae bacterium]